MIYVRYNFNNEYPNLCFYNIKNYVSRHTAQHTPIGVLRDAVSSFYRVKHGKT